MLYPTDFNNMIDILLIILTILAVLWLAYEVDKNKGKKNKSFGYTISKLIANLLNFITFLDTTDVNNTINDMEDEEKK